MARKYVAIVSTLFEFRDRLEEFRTEKNQSIIRFLKETPFDPYDYSMPPSPKEIAKATCNKYDKTLAIVNKLYSDLIESFRFNPFQVNKTLVCISISIPWDERPRGQNLYSNLTDDRDVQIEVMLPFVPRIGERISLGFIEKESRYGYGYVTEINHEISGAMQKVVLHVHPYNNYYHEWVKLRKQYETDLLRRA